MLYGSISFGRGRNQIVEWGKDPCRFKRGLDFVDQLFAVGQMYEKYLDKRKELLRDLMGNREDLLKGE